jgi:putative SOS response-associated peptidase YedK
MIDRFSIGVPASALANRFAAEEPSAYQPKYNGAPSQLFPVITNDSPNGFSFFYWGMAPAWAKNKSLAERIINLRVEQINDKPAIKKKILKQRCLVPADGFYAWKKVGKKTLIPWRFTLKTKETFALAGVWEEYEEEQDEFHTFTLLTVPATGLVLSVTERMPVILTKEHETIWLKKELEEAELNNLLSEIQNPEMEGYTVSPELNSIQHDRPSLILPMPAADQYGNLTLFD